MLKSRVGTIACIAGVTLILGLAPTASSAGQDDAVKKGMQVYAAQKCSVCHSIAGQGSKRNPLDGVGKKLSAEDTKQWIVDPVGMAKKAGSTKKPPMQNKYGKLPAADIDALVAYMQSLN
jgi:mono/diheme cytochrome c family protein